MHFIQSYWRPLIHHVVAMINGNTPWPATEFRSDSRSSLHDAGWATYGLTFGHYNAQASRQSARLSFNTLPVRAVAATPARLRQVGS